jgi:hypothetical protein
MEINAIKEAIVKNVYHIDTERKVADGEIYVCSFRIPLVQE